MKTITKNLYVRLAAVVAVFLVTASVCMLNSASAATNQLYLSPASVSVQQGGSFSVNLRVNPGVAIDTVTASIGYDAAKLTLQSVDCTGSPLTAFPSCPTSGNPVTITSYIPGSSISTDSFIAKLTFKAVAGSGTGTLNLTGDTASAGNALGASVSNTTVSFTTPTCPAGQTGTYPNCQTPTTGSGGTSSGGGTTTPTGGKSNGTGNTGTGNSTGGKTTTPTTTTTTTPVDVKIASKDIQFSLATFNTTSTAPTQVYLIFGTSETGLDQKTPISTLGTTHKIVIDSSQLVPGQKYFYSIVTTTAAGAVTQTPVDSFTTNGLSVRIGVFDKNHKPLAGKKITLHSDPMTATTDKNGYATFSNVIPGTHEVQYVAGSKTLKQQVIVANNVQTNGETQTAAVQPLSVVYNVTANSMLANARWVVLSLLVVVVVVGFLLFGRNRMHFVAPKGVPLTTASVVVGDGGHGSAITPQGSSKSEETTARLGNIPEPEKPQPGSTVGPVGSTGPIVTGSDQEKRG